MPARSPVSSPSESVGTPFTSTWRMPSASRFGSKTVPRSANTCGSKTATSARAPSRRTPRSERPIRSAGWPVSRKTASSGVSSRSSRTMNRQNHDAHVYAPWKNDSASLPSGASVVASEPGTQSRCANASRCWSSE